MEGTSIRKTGQAQICKGPDKYDCCHLTHHVLLHRESLLLPRVHHKSCEKHLAEVGLSWNYVHPTSGLWLQQCSAEHSEYKKFFGNECHQYFSFYNNKVKKVLRQLFAFTHHEMFHVWHLSHEALFYRLSVRTGLAAINLNLILMCPGVMYLSPGGPECVLECCARVPWVRGRIAF